MACWAGARARVGRGAILRSAGPRRGCARTVDDRPYGGGPGMVLKVEPLRDGAAQRDARRCPGRVAGGCTWARTGAGSTRRWRARRAAGRGWCWWPDDTRASTSGSSSHEIDEQWSIGDYVLSGGELPGTGGHRCDRAAAARRRSGSAESALQESFSDGLLDWPHYTRPPCVDGRAVPAVLASGDHAGDRGAGGCGRRWAARGCAGRNCWSGAA